MKCSRYVNVGRMHVRLNSKSLENMNSLSAWGCKRHRMDDVKGMR